MREILIIWLATIFTACAVWLWIDLLHDLRQENGRKKRESRNIRIRPTRKSRQSAKKRPSCTSEKTGANSADTPAGEV